MKTFRKKFFSSIVAMATIINFFGVNNLKSYATPIVQSNPSFKAYLELDKFNVNTTVKSVVVDSLDDITTIIDNVDINSQLKIHFEDVISKKIRLYLKNGGSLSSIVSLKKKNTNIELLGSNFVDKNNSFLSSNFNEFILTPIKLLEPNQHYKLTIKTDDMRSIVGDKNLGNGEFRFEIITTADMDVLSSVEIDKYTNKRHNAIIDYRQRNSSDNKDVDVDVTTSSHLKINLNNNKSIKTVEAGAIKIEPNISGLKFSNVDSQIIISSNSSLEPDTKYTLSIDKGLIKDISGNPLGTVGDIETYTFTTESRPKVITESKQSIQKNNQDKQLIVKFSRVMDINNNIIDGKPIANSIKIVRKSDLDNATNKLSASSTFPTVTTYNIKKVSVTDDTANITIGRDVINALPIQLGSLREDYYIWFVGGNSLKRKESIALTPLSNNADFYSNTLNTEILVPFILETSSEERKKNDEKLSKDIANKPNRKNIADSLINEIQKRYEAEYGADTDYKSFDEYMKNQSYKETGVIPTDNYIQKYLEDKGYIDDFIAKYGDNSKNLPSKAKDYMNRYGDFTYGQKVNNPLFKNPFKYGSSKEGYYDYYNRYDYGYRYPELRVGDDNISQANLEIKASLKQKEAELIAKERGYSINRGANFAINANNTPKAIITIGNRYFIQEDEFGNRQQIDMGVAPILYNDRTFVAITPLAQKLGVWVNYNSKTNTTVLSKAGTTTAISSKSSYITVNGKSENMGIRPIIRNGKMMIPAQYISKAFGIEQSKIKYEGNSIIINNY